MHSSISSSNTIERVIPTQPWGRLAVITVILCSFMIVGWEIYWRGQGYMPAINDNKDAWALKRELVDSHLDGTVLIGSSRMLFGFNLDTWKESRGELPIQLSTVGTNASIYLDHIANETEFRGTLLLGITPPLFFVPEDMPVELPTGNIKYFRNFSHAQRISHALGLMLDKNLAFIEQEDIPLKKLLEKIPVANRAGANPGLILPPYFMSMDERRQGELFLRAGHEQATLERIQSGWIPLFTPPPTPAIFTDEQFREIFANHMNATIKKAAQNVAKIRARGGKVVLIRFPSTGKVRELESKFAPRVAFWDRISNETGADQTIHFEDFPELASFNCPEWSHLTAGDAKKFTAILAQMIR